MSKSSTRTHTFRVSAGAASGVLRNSFSPLRIHATSVRLATLLLFVIAAIGVPNFASASNIAAIIYAAATVGIAAVGLATITLSGNLFSLSLGATAAFASIIFASFISSGIYLAVAGALGMGVLVGLAQGAAIGMMRCNPIITSIAVASIVTGIASTLSGGRTIMGQGDTSWLGSGVIIPGLPNQALVFLLVALVLDLIVQRMRIGRELRLTGSNSVAAQMAGLRTKSAVVMANVISATTAAAAGVLIAAQSSTGNLLVGADLDFNAISAVLVGGIAIAGGRGRVLDAAVGALFLALLGNILLVNNFSYEVQLMVKGLAVLLSVALGAMLLRMRR
ncbi:ABC transporter permease [Pseudomonas sp. S34]|nr:ABC transporter permease [Pseudomonas sp. S34]